jgi:hypothetical protein
MTDTVSRKALHSIIDTMPEHFVQALLQPAVCINEEYWKPVIEPASPEEIAMIDERIKDYNNNPSSFVPLESIK